MSEGLCADGPSSRARMPQSSCPPALDAAQRSSTRCRCPPQPPTSSSCKRNRNVQLLAAADIARKGFIATQAPSTEQRHPKTSATLALVNCIFLQLPPPPPPSNNRAKTRARTRTGARAGATAAATHQHRPSHWCGGGGWQEENEAAAVTGLDGNDQ
eukprot:COSAG05_NODE_6487_length_946_cov_2.150766_2_plen_157_part_00